MKQLQTKGTNIVKIKSFKNVVFRTALVLCAAGMALTGCNNGKDIDDNPPPIEDDNKENNNQGKEPIVNEPDNNEPENPDKNTNDEPELPVHSQDGKEQGNSNNSNGGTVSNSKPVKDTSIS